MPSQRFTTMLSKIKSIDLHGCLLFICFPCGVADCFAVIGLFRAGPERFAALGKFCNAAPPPHTI